MLLHILLPPEMLEKKPDEIKIRDNYGDLSVIFGDDVFNSITGLHCIIEGEKNVILKYLKNFQTIIKGNGNPMMESFELIKTQDLIIIE